VFIYEIDEKTNVANVHVDESQAPLAIGKNGINVKLASDLSEMEINIMQTESAVKEEVAVPTEGGTDEVKEDESEAPQTDAVVVQASAAPSDDQTTTTEPVTPREEKAIDEELPPDPVQPQDTEGPGVPTAVSETPVDEPNTENADPTAENVESSAT